MDRARANAKVLAFFTAALLLVSACASTRITSDWKDESYRKKPEKILVLSLLNETTQRRIMEDAVASRLEAAGVDAIPAYTVLPEGKLPDKDVIAATVKELGADALLISRLVDRKTVREYVPGTPYYPPASYLDWHSYYGGFYPAYPGYIPGYPPGYAPGYTVETTYDIAEANLYDAATGKLVWSAVTESRIQGADEGAIKSYASRIIKSLREQGLIR